MRQIALSGSHTDAPGAPLVWLAAYAFFKNSGLSR